MNTAEGKNEAKKGFKMGKVAYLLIAKTVKRKKGMIFHVVA